MVYTRGCINYSLSKMIMVKIYNYFLSAWYQRPWFFIWLLPIAFIYWLIISARRFLYQHDFFKRYRAPIPVIVVGNFVVGGSGKTPMVIAIAKFLQQAGYKPGIVTRGYGSKQAAQNILVNQDSDPTIVGDEPVLMALQTGCPIVKNKNRVIAVKTLTAACDVIISDDGLQHYALRSDIKIAMQVQSVNNSFLLPAGPWREPQRWLNTVDFIQTSKVSIDKIYALHNPSQHFTDRSAHAVCGIAAPWRFFDLLNDFGIKTINHAYPDHYIWAENDLQFADDLPILMTEKDAVKCKKFNLSNVWVVKIKVDLDSEFSSRLLTQLKSIRTTA